MEQNPESSALYTLSHICIYMYIQREKISYGVKPQILYQITLDHFF